MCIRDRNSLGLCTSYYHANLYQASVIKASPIPQFYPCFMIFVFDNAYHIVNTLDGYITFHCMGGIMILTPYDSLKNFTIEKSDKIRKPSIFAKIGTCKLKYFENTLTSLEDFITAFKDYDLTGTNSITK